MALWPFRRKSRRRWGRNPTFADVEDLRRRKLSQPLPPRSLTVPETITESTPATSRLPTKRNGTVSKKLQRRQRSYSFSPERPDAIQVGRKRSVKAKRAPGVVARDRIPYAENEEKKWLALDEGTFHRVPTLHTRRDGEEMVPRTMSSKKRRRNDHEREAEIKAMSSFVPLRPAADDWTSGRPMKKDSKRVKLGLGLGFGGSVKHEWQRASPSSDISLPTAESIHSTLSTDSEFISFKVSALEALAPRPTLRYAVNPRWGPAAGESGSGPVRMSSQRRKLSERGPIPEATLKAHKRVDDLADDLTAGDLRELMERDQRRREKKRQSDRERVERRLARRAEKQKTNDANGRESPPNLERGVLGREVVGLGIDPASTVVTSSKRRASGASPEQPSGEVDQAPRHQPLDTFHRTTSIPLETPFPPSTLEDPVLQPSLTASSKIRGFLRSKKSRSKSSRASDENLAEGSMKERKRSASGGSKGLSWASVFRWVNRSKRSTGGPSSFSNTSRDSMQTHQNATPAVNSVNSVNSIPVQKLNRGVPKRTRSRFREDLPELPLSPPDSRTQSPEVQPIPIPATIVEASPVPGSHSEGIAFASLPPAQNSGHTTPRTSVHKSIEREDHASSTTSRPDEFGPSPQPQSMSLASIDSEGSWLSGRLGRRRSSGIPDGISFRVQGSLQGRSSNNSPSRDQDTNVDDVSIVDDEYLSRVARPSHERSGWNRKSTGEARPSSDEGEDARWGEVNGHHPTVIHMASRMKSREGILNSLEDGESDDDLRPEPSDLKRATSVNLSKEHARNFSAGSAKLLDLSPRASSDAKRTSTDTRT